MVEVVVEYAVEDVMESPSETVRSISITVPVPIVSRMNRTVLESCVVFQKAASEFLGGLKDRHEGIETPAGTERSFTSGFVCVSEFGVQ